MKTVHPVLAATLLLAGGAHAEPPPGAARTVCVDPKFGHQVRVLNAREVVAMMTVGRDRREVKLTTTCVGLQREDHLTLSTDFACIGKGDTLVATKIDGHRQSCSVTDVAPFPSIAPGD